MSTPYTDGTFTSAKQNGATVVSYPFLNNPTRDSTTKQYQTNYAQLSGSYSPAAALNTFPGDAVFAANGSAYLVDESVANSTAAIYNFFRKWSMVPGDQILPSTKYYNRPIMNNVFSGSYYAVSFDTLNNFSWVFSSRISVQSLNSIASVTVTQAMPATNITFVEGANTLNLAANSTAAQILSGFAASLPGLNTVSAYVSTGSMLIYWNGTMSSVTPPSGVIVSNYLNTYTVSLSSTGTNTTPATTVVNATSHGGIVGDYVAFWNGNNLIGKAVVTSVGSANSFSVLAADFPSSDAVVTHCGFSSDANACYVNGPKICTVKRTQKFYLPGVTPGITTFADIPTQTIYTDPTSWLGRIIAVPTGFATIEVSDLSPWSGSILMQEIDQVQMEDAIDTVTP